MCVCVCVCATKRSNVCARIVNMCVVNMCVVLDRLLFVHAVCFLDGVQK